LQEPPGGWSNTRTEGRSRERAEFEEKLAIIGLQTLGFSIIRLLTFVSPK